MVYTFATSKGYVEKGNGISLETLARLEKRASVQKLQPKDCLISDVSCIQAGKLLGNVAILDQPTVTAPKKVEEPNLPITNVSQQSEKNTVRVSSELADHFISRSDVGSNKQVPVVSKNFFKVGNCYQCKKKKFVFQSYSNYLPHSCQKTFCSECLQDCYGEDIYKVIQSRTHWSTPFRRKICKTPSAILSTDTTGCKPENQTEEEEKVYVVDTYFKSQVKKTLELNHTLIKKLELYKSSMTTEERLLSLKVIHDNLEGLFALKTAMIDHRDLETEPVDCSYLSVINSVSRDLQAKAQAEQDEELRFEDFVQPDDLEFHVDDPVAVAEASLGKRNFVKLGSPGEEEDEIQEDEMRTYRSNKLRFDDHFD